MRKRVALLDPFQGEMLETVRAAFEHGGFELVVVADRSDSAQSAALDGADYAIPVSVPLRATNLPSHDRLRLVHKWGAGVDTVDVEALAARGIPLLRTAGANAVYVAELALALMIMARRNLGAADRDTHLGRWDGATHWTESSSIVGKTVGLIGYGAIARTLESYLVPFGCKVVRSTRIRDTSEGNLPLTELLQVADVVSLHVPLNATTRGMIGIDQLAQMKPDSTLINTARGPLVDEIALVEALRNATIGSAGLDVFNTEPLPEEHPLRSLKNVVLTPHLGGKVRENLVGVVDHIITNLLLYEAGRPLPTQDLVTGG